MSRRATDTANRAARLLFLEQRDQAISVLQHELAAERAENRDEALRLRVSLNPEERTTYDTLKLETML
jgi:hypothetical protein